METNYATLKRTTLKELLEARGRKASNKTKATLVAELMEGDRATTAATPQETEPTEFARELNSRLAFYPNTPSVETLERLIADVHEYIVAKQNAIQRVGERAPAPTSTTQGKAKIPYQAFKNYTEGESDIDEYLQDFERLCQLHDISPADQVPLLAGRLSGRAAEAYRTVPDEDIRNYHKVKQAILARYAITSEAYRLKFRDIKKQTKDSHTEWAHQLQRAAKGWMEATRVTTMEEMFQLIVMEQFFNGLTTELQNWVRDRKPRTLPEAAKLADEFQDTRRDQRTPHRTTYGSTTPLPAVTTLAHPRPAASHNQYPPRYNTRPPIRCHTCNQQGHIQRDCPRNRPRQNWNYQGPSPPNRAAVHCCQRESVLPTSTITSIEEPLGILHEVNPIQAASDNRQGHRQVVHMEGKSIQGLRDSGATLTLVRNHLVPKHTLTGDCVAVRVAGGAIYKVPTAKVHLNWGAGHGNVEVGIMQDLPADVILGNDLGELTSAFVPQPTIQEAYPVVTRQQARTTAPSDHSEAQTLLCLDWGQY
ncbi:uncharacterized protein LOC122935008 [Bufo gargarizans]|uniref:uncharacterized protein LOC122935008 n=1 Tax=Bufo gargarizans TaxID=30331 RepID=UPI001CF5E90D|nr:uncharacterized protein LOC122935008 [Bufo gargarizans]